MSEQPLIGKIAVVAGATRGAGRGTALALAAAGANVYCTGRSSNHQSGGMDRPETIEDTTDLIAANGGSATAVQVDHTDEAQVLALAEQIKAESGHLDILVNSVWGADPMVQWGKTFWQIDLADLQPYIDQTLLSHITTNRHLAPLMLESQHGLLVEMIDGHLPGYRGNLLYDLVKAALGRMSYGMAMELVETNVTALALSPGFLRSEAVLEHFGVTEENWQEAIDKDPYFAESESPTLTGRAVVALASDPDIKQKAALMLFASDLAREYGFTDYDGRVPDFHSFFDQQVTQMLATDNLDPEQQYYAWARYCQIHQDPSRQDLANKLADKLDLRHLGPGLGAQSRSIP